MKLNRRFLSLLFALCTMLAGIGQAQVVNGEFDLSTPTPNVFNCMTPFAWTGSASPVQWENRWNNGNLADWWIDLTGCGSGNGRWIQQGVPTTIGQQYVLEFDLGCWNGQYFTDAGALVYIDGNLIGRFAHTDFTGNILAWKTFQYCFTAANNPTVIRFEADGAPTYASPGGTTPAHSGVIGLDNVELDSLDTIDIELTVSGPCAPATIGYISNTIGITTWYYNGNEIDSGSSSINANTGGLYTLVFATSCDTFTLDTFLTQCDTCLAQIETDAHCLQDPANFTMTFPAGCANCISGVSIDYGDGQVDYPGGFIVYNTSHSYGSPGTYNVEVCWYNNCTGDSVCKDTTVVIVDCCLPEITADGFCVNKNTSLQVLFPEDCCIQQMTMYYGDGWSDPGFPPFHVFNHTYTSTGPYTVTLCWTTCNGEVKCEDTTIVIKDCCKPELAVEDTCVNDTTLFSITFPEKCCVQQLTIDYGDGNMDFGVPPLFVFNHNYTSPGPYNVKICWFDCEGQHQCIDTVIVIVRCCKPEIQAWDFCVKKRTYFQVDFPRECGDCIDKLTIDYGDGTPVMPGTPPSHLFSHTYMTPGTYIVKVCWYNRCTRKHECKQITINIVRCKKDDGVSTLEPENMQLYPNPTNGDFVISNIPMVQRAVHVHVHDAFGKLLFVQTLSGQNTAVVEFNNYAPGVYFICVDGSGFSKDFRLIKN